MKESETPMERDTKEAPSIADRFFDGPGKYLFPCYTAYREVSGKHKLELQDPKATRRRAITTDLLANLTSIAIVAAPIIGAWNARDPSMLSQELYMVPAALGVKGFNKAIGVGIRRNLLERAGKK